jgi:hypothetical protein
MSQRVNVFCMDILRIVSREMICSPLEAGVLPVSAGAMIALASTTAGPDHGQWLCHYSVLIRGRCSIGCLRPGGHPQGLCGSLLQRWPCRRQTPGALAARIRRASQKRPILVGAPGRPSRCSFWFGNSRHRDGRHLGRRQGQCFRERPVEFAQLTLPWGVRWRTFMSILMDGR